MPFVYPWQYWFIALIGPSKCLKQIFQRKVNRVKNPNWPESNQLAIYDRGRGFDRDYREQIQLAVRVGLELGASELQVQRTNRSATLALPPYLDVMVIQSNPAISNSVNSKSPLFRRKIEFPWIYPYFQSFTISYFELGYFEFPAISNSSFFPYTLNQPSYFELVKNGVRT